MRPFAVRRLRSAASLVVAATLFLYVLPKIAGVGLARIGQVLGSLTGVQLVLLSGIWALGLLAHSLTLAAGMPGLGHRRALMLNLTGSAVANTLPFGGAAGIALNYRMARRWGFDRGAFGTYTVVTNLWNLLFRISLAIIATAWLLSTGHFVAGRFATGALIATGVLSVLVAVAFVFLASGRISNRVAELIDRAMGAVPRASARLEGRRVGQAMVRTRATTRGLISSAWRRLTIGVVLYAILLACLLWTSLHVSGASISLPVVVAALALDRVTAMVPITPGGSGVVEVGLSGLLVALGADRVGSVTGVLLYRAFTFGLEIPVGGVGLAFWLWANRGSATPDASRAETP